MSIIQCLIGTKRFYGRLAWISGYPKERGLGKKEVWTSEQKTHLENK